MGKYEYIGKGKSCTGCLPLVIWKYPAKCAATQSLRAWNGWSLQNQNNRTAWRRLVADHAKTGKHNTHLQSVRWEKLS